VIESKGKTPAMIAGPFKTREAAEKRRKGNVLRRFSSRANPTFPQFDKGEMRN